ncbi:hypothetical protein BO70DRAFT_360227 [Aspergillus heteromorphus CBS 117.55]|uniref:Secreted protein n=1 Tax=Aspergillus heteromorphus CBS 117.55 TaxID=1448321 RepID=A0A317WRR1_9EURO|nr:uncharacterized protein BO70DRAFT_360227 [Aspergillus heteromorphus CBS 117.55]PWY87608.1 hypothetical protein BO70DRAFT_360227 [Aspergillus heteromorphus CBS 117.55]
MNSGQCRRADLLVGLIQGLMAWSAIPQFQNRRWMVSCTKNQPSSFNNIVHLYSISRYSACLGSSGVKPDGLTSPRHIAITNPSGQTER